MCLALAVTAAVINATVALVIKVGVAVAAPHPHGLAPALLADSPHLRPHSIDVTWAVIFIASIVNAYMEELVFMGYAFNQFAARRGVLAALFGVALLRMLLHTYKGPAEMLGLAAFSFVFGIAYWQLRRLWPLICAQCAHRRRRLCAAQGALRALAFLHAPGQAGRARPVPNFVRAAGNTLIVEA